MADSPEPHRSVPESAPAGGRDAAKARKSPEVHAANTNVTIAWPFSQIKLQEASAELIELAGLLSEVVDALSDLVPEARLAPLRERTKALRARLR